MFTHFVADQQSKHSVASTSLYNKISSNNPSFINRSHSLEFSKNKTYSSEIFWNHKNEINFNNRKLCNNQITVGKLSTEQNNHRMQADENSKMLSTSPQKSYPINSGYPFKELGNPFSQKSWSNDNFKMSTSLDQKNKIGRIMFSNANNMPIAFTSIMPMENKNSVQYSLPNYNENSLLKPLMTFSQNNNYSFLKDSVKHRTDGDVLTTSQYVSPILNNEKGLVTKNNKKDSFTIEIELCQSNEVNGKQVIFNKQAIENSKNTNSMVVECDTEEYSIYSPTDIDVKKTRPTKNCVGNKSCQTKDYLEINSKIEIENSFNNAHSKTACVQTSIENNSLKENLHEKYRLSPVCDANCQTHVLHTANKNSSSPNDYNYEIKEPKDTKVKNIKSEIYPRFIDTSVSPISYIDSIIKSPCKSKGCSYTTLNMKCESRKICTTPEKLLNKSERDSAKMVSKSNDISTSPIYCNRETSVTPDPLVKSNFCFNNNVAEEFEIVISPNRNSRQITEPLINGTYTPRSAEHCNLLSDLSHEEKRGIEYFWRDPIIPIHDTIKNHYYCNKEKYSSQTRNNRKVSPHRYSGNEKRKSSNSHYNLFYQRNTENYSPSFASNSECDFNNKYDYNDEYKSKYHEYVPPSRDNQEHKLHQQMKSWFENLTNDLRAFTPHNRRYKIYR